MTNSPVVWWAKTVQKIAADNYDHHSAGGQWIVEEMTSADHATLDGQHLENVEKHDSLRKA